MTKKAIFPLVLAILLAVAPVQAVSAAQPSPDTREVLLLRQSLFTLWQMGFSFSRPLDAHELCDATLRFLIRNQFMHSAAFREDASARFANIPENYNVFFDKALVEQTARYIFNGWIDQNALCPGVFLGASGYYVDMERLHRDIPINDDTFLPGYASVESLQQQGDGTLIMSGKFRRFKLNEDSGKEILWGAAPFMARFVLEDGKWRLVSFIITEEAMG